MHVLYVPFLQKYNRKCEAQDDVYADDIEDKHRRRPDACGGDVPEAVTARMVRITPGWMPWLPSLQQLCCG